MQFYNETLSQWTYGMPSFVNVTQVSTDNDLEMKIYSEDQADAGEYEFRFVRTFDNYPDNKAFSAYYFYFSVTIVGS